jgi:hypothetical protein
MSVTQWIVVAAVVGEQIGRGLELKT